MWQLELRHTIRQGCTGLGAGGAGVVSHLERLYSEPQLEVLGSGFSSCWEESGLKGMPTAPLLAETVPSPAVGSFPLPSSLKSGSRDSLAHLSTGHQRRAAQGPRVSQRTNRKTVH